MCVYVNVRQPQDTGMRVHRSSYVCTYVKIWQHLHQHTLINAHSSRHKQKQYMYIPKTLADIQMASLVVLFSAAVITVPSTPSAVGSLSRELIPRSPPPVSPIILLLPTCSSALASCRAFCAAVASLARPLLWLCLCAVWPALSTVMTPPPRSSRCPGASSHF